jgi:hypothetical protein
MNIPSVLTANNARTVRAIDYDFNVPPTDSGFYEVVVPDGFFHAGDTVVLVDDGLRRRGRIRCLMVVVEPIEDFTA